jgi:putative ABC transport system permease protein
MKAVTMLVRRVNLRHLSRKKLRTLLTVAGIASGVALLFSISVLNATLLSSFRSSIRDLAGSAELEVSATDAAGLPAGYVDVIGDVPGVERAVPVVRTTTKMTGAAGSERVVVLGITPEFVTLFPRGDGPLGGVDVSGSFGPGGEGLLLADELAERLDLQKGDTAAVETPAGTRPVAVTGRISGGAIGLLNGGEVGVMLLPAAQEVFDRGQRVDSVYVAPDPALPLGEVDGALEDALDGAGLVGPPGERGQGLERVFSSLATLLSMGGTVALFVSLFVVYNTMAMSLAERRREISMMMALGARRGSIFGGFLSEALALGIVSSVLGVCGGLWLASTLVDRAADDFRIFSITATGPVSVPLSSLLIALFGGLAVSLIGAYVPARRVLKVAPMESLRPVAAYEWEATARGFGSRRVLLAGLAGVTASVALLVAFLVHPDQKWIVTVGLLFGLAGVSLLLPRVVPFAIGLLRPLLNRAFGTVGRLSGDALAKNPGRSTFTVAALVLTLGLVVGVAGALSSYESQIERTATALIGAPLYVTSESFTGLISDQPLRAEVAEDLEQVEGVRFVYPLRFALLDLGDEQGLIYAIDVESALHEGATSELDAITDDPSAFLAGLERGDINVSRLAAESLGVEVGDRVELPTPSGAASFEVAAVFDDLLSFNSFYLDIETYRELWSDDKADEFGVLLDDGVPVGVVKARLEELIAERGLPAIAYEKEELVSRLLSVVAGTFELARGVQLAALVVAVLTIANTMFTAVLERRWEMGLERALGMGGSQLGRTVLLEAAAIGVIGGIGGIVLGGVTGFFMTQAMEAEFSWRVPFEVPVASLALAVVGATVLAALAGLLPSRLAVRTPIIESLRYE